MCRLVGMPGENSGDGTVAREGGTRSSSCLKPLCLLWLTLLSIVWGSYPREPLRMGCRQLEGGGENTGLELCSPGSSPGFTPCWLCDFGLIP